MRAVHEESNLQHTEMLTLQRRYDALNRLVQVSLVMNSTLDLDPLLEYIMQAAINITGAEAASTLLVDKNTQELRFTAAIGPDSAGLIGMVVPREGSIAGTIVSQNRAIVIDDVAHDPRHYRQIHEQTSLQTRSILGVPMRIRDALIGVLEVINKREGQFNEEDVRHITILAAQAAIAIENAQLVSALRMAYDDLNKIDKIKSDFIAIASHELRTPLGVILGYASYLKDETEGEAGELAEQLLSSASHLRNLIEDMTNLRYVQIGEAELHVRAISLGEILQQVHNDVLSLAESKGQILLLEPPKHMITLLADRPKLVMALTNVLNNAVKFTQPGGVIVLSAEERRGEVWIRIRDNGIGLPEEEYERIFDQFYQVESHLTRRHGGLGLGLAIAKAVTERHGGRIWVESAGPGLGCTFTLAIPLTAHGASRPHASQ